jgi:hypothetical protein
MRVGMVLGLASAAAFALAAAPAGAHLLCPSGITNPKYCTIVPPKGTTLPATHVKATRATLNGEYFAYGDRTQYHFEYGTTTAYGSVTPTFTADGSDTVHVSDHLHGLHAGTTYHFRLVVKNSNGSGIGRDERFKTDGPIKSVEVPHHVKHGHTFVLKVELKVELRVRAHVKIFLLHNHTVIESFDEGTQTGTVKQRITAPHKKGEYTVEVRARRGGITETVNKTIRVS